MKTIFITAYESRIVKALEAEAKKRTSELEIVGACELDDNAKQNCSFNQPDIIVTGDINVKDAKDLLEACVTANIIIVSNDMLRANSVINNLQQEGIYRVTAVDLNTVSPSQLCNDIIDLDLNAIANETEAMFSEANVMTEADIMNMPAEEVKTDESNDSNLTTEKTNVSNVNNNFENNEEEQEFDNNINNDIGIRETVRQNNFNLNINNVRSKTITVFSKKGGTGKTTIAKELSNVFSSVKLPKKLQNGNEYLKACVVDFDFERGSLRSYYGIENPSPNIYYWINDILDRLENKTDISKIYYNQFQVLGYLKKVPSNGNYYALITGQGGIPVRTLSRIVALDEKGDLLLKILKIIIDSLKRTFDIVIFDTNSVYDEITKLLFENSDNILYVLNPTIADIENLKVFADEIAINPSVDLNRVGIILNKMSKHLTIKNDLLDILSLVKYKDVNFTTGAKIDKNFNLICDIPYDENIVNFNNSFLFVTNNGTQETKKGFLKTCEFCLPVFKVKRTTQGLEELKRLQAKKAKLAKKKAAQSKNSKEKKIAKLKNVSENENQDVNVQNNVEETKQVQTTNVAGNINEYLSSDLSKETYDAFIEKLSSFEGIKKTKSGFPILRKKPAKLNKQVWKNYQKNLNKEAKLSLKMKRAGQ